MGNSYPYSQQEQQNYEFPKLQFKKLNSRVWQNTIDFNHQVKQYEVSINTQSEINNFQRIFILRRNSNFIVRTQYLNLRKSEQICSTKRQGIIYIQNDQLRLCDISDIPFPDYLHLYNQCLRGFGELYEQFGAFGPDEEHICINTEAKVKVWINNNLVSTTAEHQMALTAQTQMLRQILFIIKRNSFDESSERKQNIQTLLSTQKSFKSAIDCLNKWCKLQNILPPENLACVIKNKLIIKIEDSFKNNQQPKIKHSNTQNNKVTFKTKLQTNPQPIFKNFVNRRLISKLRQPNNQPTNPTNQYQIHNIPNLKTINRNINYINKDTVVSRSLSMNNNLKRQQIPGSISQHYLKLNSQKVDKIQKKNNYYVPNQYQDKVHRKSPNQYDDKLHRNSPKSFHIHNDFNQIRQQKQRQINKQEMKYVNIYPNKQIDEKLYKASYQITNQTQRPKNHSYKQLNYKQTQSQLHIFPKNQVNTIKPDKVNLVPFNISIPQQIYEMKTINTPSFNSPQSINKHQKKVQTKIANLSPRLNVDHSLMKVSSPSFSLKMGTRRVSSIGVQSEVFHSQVFTDDKLQRQNGDNYILSLFAKKTKLQMENGNTIYQNGQINEYTKKNANYEIDDQLYFDIKRLHEKQGEQKQPK